MATSSPYRVTHHLLQVAVLWPALALAQTPPTAGSLLQQIEQSLPKSMPPASPLPKPVQPPAMQPLAGARLVVVRFEFSGNRLLGTDQLAQEVASFLNRELDFNQLQAAATAVAEAYRKAGWIVRAYLPEQDIKEGVVTIQVVEAVFGSLRLEGESWRISQDQLRAIVHSAQAVGQPLQAQAIDRALLLIDDLPGVGVVATMTEGQSQGETDLVLKSTDKLAYSAELVMDNTGSRSTGTERVSLSINVNSPLGIGDQLGGNFVHTLGSDYLRGSYSVPVGHDGWRLGGSFSHMDYRVLNNEATPIDAGGKSATWGVEANYPIVRSRLKNLHLALNHDRKRFDNHASGSTTTKYSATTSTLGLNANLYDNWGGGGANSANIAWVSGNIDLSGSPNEAADAASTQTAGAFSKVRFGASRQQVVSDEISIFASVSGQKANKNLDSSEKFYLGGPAGVRAYPASEGGGSEGMLVNVELRTRIPWDVNMTTFYDWGTVLVNRNNDITGAASLNSFNLRGLGVALSKTTAEGITLKATVARRIGDNPNPTSTGTDQDGSLRRYRLWLQASVPVR
ncbi:MAG: ShlB/FhaC/HecB family hemolysin secretion/activation protein [Rhodoferax sp.]|nr:ShlB/FhaC/HecB family hemolysin secretion/activation protein [Rhodoferax sp.]